jgi:hypothetical protein
MKENSVFTKVVLVIIILHLFLLFPACGKKGDPIPTRPEQPKTDTGAQPPEKPAGVTPAK